MTWILKVAKIGLVSLVVLLAVVVTLLPFVVRWQAVAWLERQGLEASIGYVDIRPVLGAVQVNDVRITASNGEHLTIGELHFNIAWRPLLDQWLQVENFLLDNVAVDLVMEPDILRVGGIPIPVNGQDPDASEESVPGVINRLSLEKIELHQLAFCYSRVNAQNERLVSQCASLGELSQTGGLEVSLGEQGRFSLPGINLKDIQWYDQQQPLSLAVIESLSVSDIVSPDMTSWSVGKLDLAALALLPDSDQALMIESLGLRELNAAEEITARQLLLGEVAVSLQPGADGALAFAPALMTRIGELASSPATATASVDQAAATEATRISLQTLTLARLDVASDRPLLGLSALGLEALSLQGAEVSLARAQLSDLGVLPGTDDALALEKLVLTGLAVGGNIAVDTLLLGDARVHLQPGRQGELTFAPALMAQLSPSSDDQSLAETADNSLNDQTPQGRSAMGFSLGKLTTAGLQVTADRELLSLASLELEKLALQGADVSLAGLRFASLGVLSGTDDALAIEKLALTGLNIGEDVAIDDLSLGKVEVHLQDGQHGELAFAPTLMAQLSPSTDDQALGKNSEDSPNTAPPQNNSAMGFSLGRLTTAGVHVRAERELLSLTALQLQQLNLKNESLGLDRLAIDTLMLLSPAAPISRVEHYISVPGLSLDGFSKDSDGLVLSSLSITDPALFLHRGSGGELIMLEELAGFAGQPAEVKNTGQQVPESDSAPFSIKIGEVRIGENGQLRVLDESVSPPLAQEFSKLNFSIRHLDASRPAEGGAINFHLGVNRFGYLKLSGDLAPFGDTLNTAIGGELNGLDVRDLSGYAGKYIGYHLDQGTVDADIDVKVEQDQINAAITTRFNKLEVSSIPEADLPEGAEQLGVPLEFALALLRDNDGMIELKLPIGGNIHSPDFSLNHIIGKVLFKVISETVISYYLPFGLLAKSLVENSLASLAFQPVAFAPGLATLDAPALENLKTLAEMLQNRQQLHLVFCAPATLQDWRANFAPDEPSQEKTEETQRESTDKPEAAPEPVITPEQATAMTALADQRTEATKAYLVNAGVKPGQVIPCSSFFDQARDSAPEMTITIGQ